MGFIFSYSSIFSRPHFNYVFPECLRIILSNRKKSFLQVLSDFAFSFSSSIFVVRSWFHKKRLSFPCLTGNSLKVVLLKYLFLFYSFYPFLSSPYPWHWVEKRFFSSREKYLIIIIHVIFNLFWWRLQNFKIKC